MQLVEVSVLSGSFPPCDPPRLGCFLAWTLVQDPCFFFSPFHWVLSFYNVWHGFINGYLQTELFQIL
jgi:hypothetical protein